MFKRVLGYNVDDDSDDDLTSQQKDKFARRFIQGAKHAGNVHTKRQEIETPPATDDENEDAMSGSDDENSGSDSDDVPVSQLVDVASTKKTPIGFQFQCELCPDKALVSQQDYDKHMQSKSHLKQAKRFAHAEKIGFEAYVKECEEKQAGKKKKQKKNKKKKKTEGIEVDSTSEKKETEEKDGAMSVDEDLSAEKKAVSEKPRLTPEEIEERNQKSQQWWKEKRKKNKSKRDAVIKDDEGAIQKLKDRFAAKKARRMARKNAEKEGAAK